MSAREAASLRESTIVPDFAKALGVRKGATAIVARAPVNRERRVTIGVFRTFMVAFLGGYVVAQTIRLPLNSIIGKARNASFRLAQ